VTARELNAAGILHPRLRASYDACRRVNAAHGRTFYLATLLLPPAKRPAVHALYAFARRADEIVDAFEPSLTVAERERRLDRWTETLIRGTGDDPIVPAVHDTIVRYNIPLQYFESFLTSMHMDLVTTEYGTWDELLEYMHGSAAVIGLQMLPVLGCRDGKSAAAAPYASDLGIAFQLTNFIRDVGEDLDRGRVYLPKEDLAAFSVTRADLERRVVDGNVRRLLAFEIARAREIYRSAEPGIQLLDPTSQDCIRTALRLYRRILTEVERADYRVLDRRVAVSRSRRAAVALLALARAHHRRRRSPR
jgi:phytoene synthase